MLSVAIHFRALEDADLAELEAFFPEPVPHTHSRRLAKQHEDRCLYVAAVTGADKIAAIQLIRWEGSTLPEHRKLSPYPEIGSLYVLPAYRRQGIASRILEFSESKIAQRGFKGASLAIKDNNDASIAMHIARGYVPVGKGQPTRTEPNEPRTYYAKQLQ